MLEYLQLQPGETFLDVGTGSGYLAVVAAHLVDVQNELGRGSGTVVAVDYIAELVAFAINNIENDDPSLLKSPNFIIKQGDAWKEIPFEGQFDKIHVGAAPDKIPQTLIDKLRIGGKIIVPVGEENNQILQLATKLKDGTLEKRELMGVRFVKLVDANKKKQDDKRIRKHG
eukprot:GHVT01025877.1.p1 GENE.GHVT01025877.1~~GHVT01025877.1.p1  ORF type:complete len:171 (+),score=21.54 GHVT01025877.1:529-1041(+)